MRVAITTLVFLFIAAAAQAQTTKDAPAPASAKADRTSQAELERAFAAKMSNATLAGHFTTRSREGGPLPKAEKYSLGKVSKLQGDYWLIQARIQYGEHDVTLPLTLRVLWAGDTPVITLDKVPIPGFGTFTCRVMIFGDEYAGTWDGGDHGGHLFGKILPPEKKSGTGDQRNERPSNGKSP